MADESAFRELIATATGVSVEHIDLQSNWYAIGGDSISALKLTLLARERLRVALSVSAVLSGDAMSLVLERAVDLCGSEAPAGNVQGGQQLTPAERRMYFLHQYDSEGTTYNIRTISHLSASVDTEKLQECLDVVVARNRNLRARFTESDGAVVRLIQPAEASRIMIQYSSSAHSSELLEDFPQARFNLASEPLLRVEVRQNESDVAVIVLDAHHIVCDAWSIGVILSELSSLYNRNSPGQLAALLGDVNEKPDVYREPLVDSGPSKLAVEYWQNYLRGIDDVNSVRPDRSRPSALSNSGASCRVLMEGLDRAVELYGCTRFNFLMTVVVALLSRYGMKKDVILGVPIANRAHAGALDAVGLLVNTIVYRLGFGAETSFADLARQVGEHTRMHEPYSDCPFDAVVDALQPTRSASYNPIFQIAATYLKNTAKELQLGDAVARKVWSKQQSAMFDLYFEFEETDKGMELNFIYSTDLFDRETIEQMSTDLLGFARQAIENPGAIVAKAELASLAGDWDQAKPAARAPASGPLVFEKISKNFGSVPDAVAVRTRDSELTYRELSQQVERYAARYLAAGVKQHSVIAICMSRGADMLAAMLAVWRVGGTYVPMDPTYPEERLRHYLVNSGAELIVSDKAGVTWFEREGVSNVNTCEFASQNEPELVGGVPKRVLEGSELAYIMYTSGSTGLPKGVGISHRNLTEFLDWAEEEFSQAQVAMTLASTSICFDISILELFLPLVHGAACHIVPNILAIADDESCRDVTYINTVPSAMEMLAPALGRFKSLKLVGLGGEPLKPKVARAVFDAHDHCDVYNLYGPTEVTVYATVKKISRESCEVTIGAPIRPTTTYVLDEHYQRVPTGVVGDLFLGGTCVSPGYFKDKTLTRAKFPVLAWSRSGAKSLTLEESGEENLVERVYRTGDRAFMNRSGELEFIGRVDNQVKLRGFRIDLGEIESVLETLEEVSSGVVVLKTSAAAESYLAAYVVWCGDRDFRASDVKEKLGLALPSYMVPSEVARVEEIPLTLNGKVDRKKLERLEGSGATPESRKATSLLNSRNPFLDGVVRLAAPLLKVTESDVNVRENFFDMRGSSLLLVRLIMLVEKKYGVKLPMRKVFADPTIWEISEIVRQTHSPS